MPPLWLPIELLYFFIINLKEYMYIKILCQFGGNKCGAVNAPFKLTPEMHHSTVNCFQFISTLFEYKTVLRNSNFVKKYDHRLKKSL